MSQSLLGRRTLLRGIAALGASALAGAALAPQAEAATVSIKIWDDWLGKYLYLYAQTFYAPYYDSAGRMRYKVFVRYYASGATSGGRYVVSSGRGKLSNVTSWVSLPIGNFKQVGTIAASSYGTIKVDTHVWVYDYKYNSGSWRVLPRTV
jgi:hypothetical protein